MFERTLRILASSLRLAAGGLAFAATGRTPAGAYQSMIRLFMLTGGRSNDLAACWLSALHPPYPLPAAEGILGPLPPARLGSVVSLEQPFRTPITYESTRVAGASVKAATRAELDRWFLGVGARLKPGDTLLLYVTDHGRKNAEDTRNNRITLWGKGASVSVAELRALLAKVDPRVRVVMLMSQ